MRNLIILILGVTTVLTSCGTSKNTTNDVSENQVALLYEEENQEYFSNMGKTQVDTSDIKVTNFDISIVLPGEVDNSPKIVDTVNFYSTYLVNYKNGQSQRLTYEYRRRLTLYDSLNVTHVDTIQYKVSWSEL